MKSTVVALVALTSLAACGGGGGAVNRDAPAQLFASGPIQRACLAEGRREASGQRCGCVQAVADRELSAAQQRRGVRAFKDPHRLQEWRQSDRASDNAFWRVWKAYGETAARLCS